MKFRNTVLIGLVLVFSVTTVSAQSDLQESIDTVESLVVDLDTDIQELRTLTDQLGNADIVDRQALAFRRDDRSFKLLADADVLARSVSRLPTNDPRRKKIEEKLTADLDNTTVAVFERIDTLDHYITKNSVEIDSLGGGARVSAESYLQVLDSIRFQYYSALINHLESRKLLGLSMDDSKKRLAGILYLHGEALVGQIEFSSASLEDLQGKLQYDVDNAVLLQAVTNLTADQSESIDSLSLVVDLLDRLQIDTTDYTAVLLLHQGGISVNLFQSGVIDQLLADWFSHAKTAAADTAPDLILNLLIFLFVIFVFRYLSRLTRRVVRASCERSSLDLSVLLKDILVSASGGAVMILGFLMALSQIGISLGPMLAGLGVAGFIVGFALQDTLGNFAAGAMILIYQPYDVDDFVEVTGASGLVKKMNLVSTTITTFDNQTLVIPNSKIWGDVIKNVTAQKVRRVDLEFGIGYNDDIEKTERVLTDILDSHDMILKSPEPLIKVHTLGESSVNFIVRPWTKTEDYWDVYWDLTREVKLRFDREGISIPFPQRDIHHYREEPG
jgi:small conductance mechanosensitive channel